MAKFEDLIKKREQLIADAEAQATTRLRGIESDSWSFIADVITGLDTVEGRLVFKASNIRKVNTGVLSFSKYLFGRLVDFSKWIAGRFLSLFGLNLSYFNQVEKRSDSTYDQAKKLLLLRWGWDVEKSEVIPGGFLSNAFNVQGVADVVAQRITAGISGGMDLRTFTKVFKADFTTSSQGVGTVVKNFERVAQESFQIFDRTTQNVIATDLGLTYALYSGTEIKTTRPFCHQRFGRIFSRAKIESWNVLDWQGKIDGSNVIETLGGFNCRHHLSWLSSEMVELLKKRGTLVDELNP